MKQSEDPAGAELDRLRARLEETEAALRRERDLVRLVSETTPVGLVTLDLDGQIMSANASAEELLGISREQIADRTYNDPRWRITDYEGRGFPDEELPFYRVLATGEAVQDVRLALLRPDGRRVFLSISAAPIVDDDGRVTGVLAVFDNVTEQHRSQQELEASETRYRSLFNSMQDAFSLQEIIFDEDGKPCDYRFLEVNPAFEKMTGIPASQWIGRTVKEVLPGTEAHWIELCGEVARTGDPVRVEQYSQAFDRYYEVLAYRPGPNQCAALSTDVTERKRAAESLLQRSRLDATATLAGGVAHDFNNLMVSVVGNADHLRRTLAADGETAAMLDRIVEAGRQAGRLAQQMLSFARPTKSRAEVVDIADAIEETLRLQTRSIRPDITVERECAPGLWAVRGDSSQLIQVLMNLCINAAEAIERDGRIQLRARNIELPEADGRQTPALKAGRYVLLSVTDDGRGMEPAVRDRIFEPFFSTKDQGRGLGLAAVHGIVHGHGGDIVVTSQAGEGTTFDVYLPASTESSVPAGDEEDPSLQGTETVLLVDDDTAVLTIVSSILESFGYTVLAADSGQAAVQMAETYEGAIHLAILDLGMPVMSGKDTFPLLARARPDMKIIICSGYDQRGDAEALLEAGADGFVSKPFLPEDLIRPMRAALDE